MKIAKNKTLAIAITTLLAFSMTASLMLIPTANAHTPPWTVPTYCFINVAPNPIGVGQTISITFWIDLVPPTAEGPWGDRWHDMTITVTKPDGTTLTLGPYTSDPTGGVAGVTYVPTEAGNYTFVGHFPQQIANNANPYPYGVSFEMNPQYVNDTFLASNSSPDTVTVQTTRIPSTAYPFSPLPTSYWTNPINAMNPNWAVIGGNWLGLAPTDFGYTGMYSSNDGNFDPYSTAPSSAHVMWTKPVAFGGEIGGPLNGTDTDVYASGTAYEAKFNPIIISGILYYTQYPGAANNPGPLTAVDLHTGTTLWTVNANGTLLSSMVYDFATGDQYGAHAYLFTGNVGGGWASPEGWIAPTASPTWSMYDAMTGQWILNIANANPGTLTTGPKGELLSYTSDGTTLTMWNASLCIATASQEINIYETYSAKEIWRPPQGATIQWSGGNQWTVPINTTISGAPISPLLSIAAVDTNDGVVWMSAINTNNPAMTQTGYEIAAGYSTTDGHLLWGPTNRTEPAFTAIQEGPATEGVCTEYNQQLMTWTGYSITTGEKLWTTQPYNNSLGYFDESAKAVLGYGNLYTFSFNGEVYCYNIATGAKVWGWYAGSAGLDSPYGTWPLGTWGTSEVLADGMLYIEAGHDYTPPVFRGCNLYCLNATNGQLIWKNLSFDVESGPALADGIMLWYNGYDNQVYAYGMGPSKTTVTAPDIGVTTATPITITGSVTDISAGASQEAVAANFPNGLPCVSDASMSQFMEAVYEQQPMPTNIIGVPVQIAVLDSNGNHYPIGTVTTDASGFYSLHWTPIIPGNYTVYATFAGTQAYYGSSAEAAFYASSPPPTPASTAPLVTGLASTGTVELGIAVLAIVIIIVGIVLAILTVRKRP